jgi:hypothetical protein
MLKWIKKTCEMLHLKPSGQAVDIVLCAGKVSSFNLLTARGWSVLFIY